MKTRTSKQENYFKKYFEKHNFNYATKALSLINQYHTGTRRDGDEERSHLFEVLGFAIANFEGRLNPDELQKLIVVSALHDLVEDYSDKITFKILKTMFPKDYIRSIKKVTKWSTFEKNERNYKHYHGKISKDYISIIVKATDRLHNLNSCTSVFNNSKKIAYISETETFIIPNLKKLRKEKPELYASITFLIYNLKNQIKQLQFIIDQDKLIKLQSSIIQEKDTEIIKLKAKNEKTI